MGIQEDAIRLAETFFGSVKKLEKDANGKFASSKPYKQVVLKDAYLLLANGYAFAELNQKLQEKTALDNSAVYNLTNYFETYYPGYLKNALKPVERQADELLTWGEFYFHPLLQRTSAPPRYVYDENTMTYERQEMEPFYLEMVPSFTLRDLTTYFIEQVKGSPENPERFHTQFRRLLQGYTLDEVLYLIDYAVIKAEEDGKPAPVSPTFLVEYEAGIWQMLGNRKWTLKQAGLDRIHPRQTH